MFRQQVFLHQPLPLLDYTAFETVLVPRARWWRLLVSTVLQLLLDIPSNLSASVKFHSLHWTKEVGLSAILLQTALVISLLSQELTPLGRLLMT